MKFHWKVLSWMLAGVIVGLGMQFLLEAGAWMGAEWRDTDTGVEFARTIGPEPSPAKDLVPGSRLTGVVRHRGQPDEERVEVETSADVDALMATARNGEVLWLELGGAEPVAVTLAMDPASSRGKWIAPLDFVADIFMALLKMLIVPIILTSIINGVAGVGSMKDLGRLGGKTFSYYVATSLLAIVVGQVLVNVVRPGEGARLGLPPVAESGLAPDESFIGILKRMVPSNIFESFSSNSNMLQVIFFALLFGFFVTRARSPHRERVKDFFESAFEVMLKMAEGILLFLPYGVFCLMVRVVAKTGVSAFEPLLLYMATVALALVVHACVTLPLVLKLVGGLSPRRWFQAMSPAVMTAFSTSSSSMTLPVTLETVEKRGGVSNKVTSFTLPLGATINMDGTALYECIGVIFLAQYYAGAGGFELTLAHQGVVVVMALLASVGAAGIPSAGLIMMLTILSALGLPTEGAALLLAVDRPLDMMRTMVNVWSDSCGAAVIARSEGELGPLSAGAPT